MNFWSSTTEITDNLLPYCQEILHQTLTDSQREEKLAALGKMASLLEAFVHGYERIDDPAIDTDDEILNWAFSETPTDLASAIWLLASGFYKASASSLRNALDIATASLYFQVRENRDPAPKGYNRFFSEWDRGERDTPSWGEMKTILANVTSVKRFQSLHRVDMVEHAYEHFKLLCGYSHTRAFAVSGQPVTAINSTGVAPAYDEACFVRGCELVGETISMIAMLWQVVYPQIAATGCPGRVADGTFDKLFQSSHGPAVLKFR